MRLLLVSTDFPPHHGGMQTFARELAKHLAERCTDFAVLTSVQAPAEADLDLPYDVYRRPAPGSLLLPSLLRLHRRRPFDAVFHVHWQTAVLSALARRIGWRPHVSIAAHGRELLLNPLSVALPVAWTYPMLRREVLGAADRVFPVSRFTRNLALQRGARLHRTSLLGNGTDPDRFAPAAADALRSRLGGAPVLLTVSRLIPRKGIDTVIQALPYLQIREPGLRYVVVGEGRDRKRLADLARRCGVRERVAFAGCVADDELVAYYNACDIFVMPARAEGIEVEGFGLSFLEAGACAKPVIGTPTGGIPDAIADGMTGLLVPPDAPVPLADAILRLTRHPELAARLGRQARAHVLRQARWAHVADRLYATIRHDLHGTGPLPPSAHWQPTPTATPVATESPVAAPVVT